jgi:hypothetical protein
VLAVIHVIVLGGDHTAPNRTDADPSPLSMGVGVICDTTTVDDTIRSGGSAAGAGAGIHWCWVGRHD